MTEQDERPVKAPEVKKEKGDIKAQSIGKGFVILSAATIAVKLMSLIFVPVMKNLLGDGGYGVFGATNEVFAFIYVIATAGIPVAVSKIVTEFTAVGDPYAREKAFKLAKRITGIIGLSFMVLLAALAIPISRLIKVEEAWAGLMCIAPTVFICAFLSVYRGYFQGRKNMTPTAVSQVAEQVIHVVVAVVAAGFLIRFGIVWAVAGASLGTAVASLISLFIVKYYYKRSSRKIRDELLSAGNSESTMSNEKIIRRIFLYGIPITLSSGIQYGGNLVDVGILVGRLEAGGFTPENAKVLYGQLLAARQLLNVATSLTTALCVSILPAIAASFAVKNLSEAGEKAAYGYKLCFTVAFPMAGAFALYSSQIYSVLHFGSNNMILTYMSLSVVLMGLVHLQGSVLNSINKLYTATINLGIGVVVKAILNYILVAIPSLNLYGAIISTYAAYTVSFILNALAIRRSLGKCHFVKTIWPPLVSTLCMLAASFGLYKLLTLAFSPLFGPTHPTITIIVSFGLTVIFAVWFYALIMGLTKGLTASDIDSISPKLRKFLPKTIK